MKLLKQKGTGDIYPWTEYLALRDDMEEVGSVAPQAEPQEAVEETNTSENPDTETAEPAVEEGLAEAAAAFRKAVSKPGRKTKAQG